MDWHPELYLSDEFLNRKYSCMLCTEICRCITKNVLMQEVLYDGDIETWLLKWNRMDLGLGMGFYGWQTTSNSFETKSSI